MYSKLREPINGLTHLFGAFLSLLGTIFFVIYCIAEGKGMSYVLTFIIYGISLVLLYSASSIYHMVRASDRVIQLLRKIDHSMIYVLIAGTYTPICIIILNNARGYALLAAVWIFAVAGIIFKLCWINAPRWLGTSLYVIMGWLIIWVISPLSHAVPAFGIFLLFLGGIFYTVGAVIYGTKWPKFTSKYLGFHEIFHIFVLFGGACFYIFMFKYILLY